MNYDRQCPNIGRSPLSPGVEERQEANDTRRRWTRHVLFAGAMVFASSLQLAAQQGVDIGDVAIGRGAVRPVASITNETDHVVTYFGTIEGSSQFAFDPASMTAQPGQEVFIFVLFRATRLGRDSAIAHIVGVGTNRVYGRGVPPSAVMVDNAIVGVRLRQIDDGATTIVELTQQRAGRVRISIWSADGRFIFRPIDDFVSAGEQVFHIGLGALSSGTYLFRIESSEGAWSRIVRR